MLNILFVVMNDYWLWGIPQAADRIRTQYPDTMVVRMYAVREVNEDPVKELQLLGDAGKADFAVILAHGSIQALRCFTRLWKQLSEKKPVYFTSTIAEELAKMLPMLGLTQEGYQLLDGYFRAGSLPDMEQFLLAACNLFGRGRFALKPPSPPKGQGIYAGGRILTEDEEDTFRKSILSETRPVIGVLIHDYYVRTGNLAHVNALITAIEERGCVPFALADSFTADHKKKTGMLYRMERMYRRTDGSPIPCALVLTYGFSLTTLSGKVFETGRPPESFFEAWKLPVIQGLTTYFSEEEYRRDIRGLDLISLPITVYQPEFDGQLISVPFAVTEQEPDGKRVCRPLKDRVDRVAELAARWGGLSRKPMSEKRIAIIFHNMPPRNDTIGDAHALDSPESVYGVVRALKERGLSTEFDFQDGQEIIQKIRDAVTNDNQWLSPEAVARRAAAFVSAGQYQEWFGRLNPETRKQMEESWGKAPGEVMVSEGRLVIPGIRNGNLFIGLQPLRSAPEKAEELYHSTDNTPPHSYLAFYRWIDEVFRADAILHVGTHGTLEWLPGKEVGLSSGCFGDICIGGIPHLYIYNISILGEGIQAKRRSYACVTDHMIPSMDESDTYGELTDLDEAIDEYYHARQARRVQLSELAGRIFDLAEKLSIVKDLGMSRETLEQDPDKGISLLHRWVSKIKSSLVRDGLHVFGKAEEGIRFDNLLRSLLRVPNLSVPGLTDSILDAQGYDSERIRAYPEAEDADGTTGYMRLDQATEVSRRIFARLAAAGYDPCKVNESIEPEHFPGNLTALRKVLDFACRTAAPALRRTTEEMELLMHGLEGRFVPPLPGGSPSRGNVHILPTGRNFYAIDPAAIPSRSAWEIGQALARQAIEAYRREKEGAWPESMAIVVYSDECMKTHGEDIAEAMALMGVRPIYLGDSNRVVGVEPISLKELGRPRIDAVLRISGLFRDTFPNVVELVEQAVLSVSALDELPKQNYVRKHTEEEFVRLVAEGMTENEAGEQASLRVFGCPPGTYGAGVDKAIHSRNWENFEDLSKVYTLWSAHGYSRHFHGEAMPKLFSSRLSTVGVTIKNESSVEIDMLDCDDFYSYHGGLMAAVRTSSGEKPVSVAGLTADVSRPETTTVKTELARVMRSRILNPKWLSGLKRHGYKGAQELSTTFDTFFGWDATAEVAENWMYDEMAGKFLLDDETRTWIGEVNDAALYQLASRFLEAQARGMWEADERTLEAIRNLYLELEGNLEDEYYY